MNYAKKSRGRGGGGQGGSVQRIEVIVKMQKKSWGPVRGCQGGLCKELKLL